MKKSEKETLITFFGKTLNLTAEDVAPIFEEKGDDHELKSDALKVLLGHDATRVKTFKDEISDTEKKSFDKGYKKAQAEVLPKLEKDIKTKYEIDSDKQGLELIEELVSSKMKVTELDAEKVKLHPEFLKLEKDLNKKLKETEDNFTKKINDREAELNKEKTFSDVTKKANAILDKLNPILPEDKAKREKQLSLLYNDLKKYGYTDNKGELLILSEDGKRLEDEHGKPVSFESLVQKSAGEYWDFASGQSRTGAGASNDEAAKAAAAAAAASGKKTWAKAIPKSDSEFSVMFSKLTEANDRIALTEAYEAEQAKAAQV